MYYFADKDSQDDFADITGGAQTGPVQRDQLPPSHEGSVLAPKRTVMDDGWSLTGVPMGALGEAQEEQPETEPDSSRKWKIAALLLAIAAAGAIGYHFYRQREER